MIVLTARDSVTDTVSALEGGADDYMAKPFRFAELLARVHLRLRQRSDNGDDRSAVLEAGGVSLDVRTRRATVGSKEVELSAREFRLAEVLMTNAGQVLSREQLLDQVWGFDFDPGPTWSTSTSATCARSSVPTRSPPSAGWGIALPSESARLRHLGHRPKRHR